MAIIKSQYTLRLDLTTFGKIKKIAKAENRSLNNMIDYVIKQEIARYEQQNGEISLDEDDLFLK